MKPDGADLRRSIDTLEGIQRSLGAIARRSDRNRARDLIDGRRALVQQLTLVAEQGTAVFEAVDPDVAREFRRRFGAMRSAVSHLQATWPAVRMRDDTSGDYAREVAKVRQGDTECLTWIRLMLTRLEGTNT